MKDPQPGQGVELDPQVSPLLLSRPPRTFLLPSLLQWSLPLGGRVCGLGGEQTKKQVQRSRGKTSCFSQMAPVARAE